jgi:hypothetical protein
MKLLSIPALLVNRCLASEVFMILLAGFSVCVLLFGVPSKDMELLAPDGGEVMTYAIGDPSPRNWAPNSAYGLSKHELEVIFQKDPTFVPRASHLVRAKVGLSDMANDPPPDKMTFRTSSPSTSTASKEFFWRTNKTPQNLESNRAQYPTESRIRRILSFVVVLAFLLLWFFCSDENAYLETKRGRVFSRLLLGLIVVTISLGLFAGVPVVLDNSLNYPVTVFVDDDISVMVPSGTYAVIWLTRNTFDFRLESGLGTVERQRFQLSGNWLSSMVRQSSGKGLFAINLGGGNEYNFKKVHYRR